MEVIATVAVLSVSVAIAAPALGDWVQGVRQTSMAHGMLSDLSLARGESIRRGKRVVLCSSGDGVTCAATGHWQQGRIVFVDDNNNAVRDMSEALLVTEAAGPGGWLLKGNGSISKYIAYVPTGRTRQIGGGLQMGTLTICPVSALPVKATQIVISATGRPRSQRTTLANCTS